MYCDNALRQGSKARCRDKALRQGTMYQDKELRQDIKLLTQTAETMYADNVLLRQSSNIMYYDNNDVEIYCLNALSSSLVSIPCLNN